MKPQIHQYLPTLIIIYKCNKFTKTHQYESNMKGLCEILDLNNSWINDQSENTSEAEEEYSYLYHWVE